MPNSKDVFNWVLSQISLDEPLDEIKSIAYLLLEHESKLTRAQIIAGKQLPAFDRNRVNQLIARINLGEPIQYILGEQHFYGRPFKVDQRVLIPRPETELLVSCILQQASQVGRQKLSILDIGTGSGCLAITLALEIPLARVTGTDISTAAIELAKSNNLSHQASARFVRNDVLHDPLPEGIYDFIVSNPPYITMEEKSEIKDNVLKFEPHLALFVSTSAPLLFYEVILAKGIKQLKMGGMLAVEINERYGREVVALFEKMALQKVETVKDLQGKERVVRGFV